MAVIQRPGSISFFNVLKDLPTARKRDMPQMLRDFHSRINYYDRDYRSKQTP